MQRREDRHSGRKHRNLSDPDDSKTTEDTKPAKTEKTKIVYWHSYTDQHEEKFLELAAAFNASQDEYELVAEQQPYSEIDSQDHAGRPQRHGPGPCEHVSV